MCNEDFGIIFLQYNFFKWYKSQKTCDNAVDTCPFLYDCVLEQYMTQEMCDKVVFKESYLLKYCLDKY